jgi:hypothetical protein
VTATLYTVVAGTLMFGEHLPKDATDLGLRLAGLAMITAALFWLPLQSGADRVEGHRAPTSSYADRPE